MLLIRDWSGSESTPAGWRTRHTVPQRTQRFGAHSASAQGTRRTGRAITCRRATGGNTAHRGV